MFDFKRSILLSRINLNIKKLQNQRGESNINNNNNNNNNNLV